jgi:predicted nucleic acid-binding protein
VRPSFDTNILIYAIGDTEPEKKKLAQQLIVCGAGLNAILTQQVYGEFLNLCLKRPILSRERAAQQVAEWQEVFPPVPTSAKDQIAAFNLACRYQLQYWDALILHVSAVAGSDVLLSEDMQNGFLANGVRVLNPFDETNQTYIQTLLAN